MSGSHVRRKGYAMVKIVCWNIRRSPAAYPALQEMDADIALLQEVGRSAAEQMQGALGGSEERWDWDKHDRWPAVVKLSDRVDVEWFRPIPLMAKKEEDDEIAVSDLPTLAAAQVTPLPDGEPFIVVSMYARWYWPHPLARNAPVIRKLGTEVIREFADASAHRIISDLSGFIAHTNPANHRIIAAGDLNTIRGAVEGSRNEMPIRAKTIFDRMTAIGMEFMGPRADEGGRKADPPSVDVPLDTCNVPTYLCPPQKSAFKERDILSGNQLDYVFASRVLDESVRVRAMNKTSDEWGPSDHCRIVIDVG